MKTLITALILAMTVTVQAQTIDLTKAEVKQDITKYMITDITIHQVTKQAIVTTAKGYMKGAGFVPIEEFTTIFQNVIDNPDTPNIDETSNAYTQFISSIGIRGNLVKAVMRARLRK